MVLNGLLSLAQTNLISLAACGTAVHRLIKYKHQINETISE